MNPVVGLRFSLQCTHTAI